MNTNERDTELEELLTKINNACIGYSIENVGNSILTMLTWVLMDMCNNNLEKVNSKIKIFVEDLQKSCKMASIIRCNKKGLN